MIKWLKSLFKRPEPEVKLAPLPVDLNPDQSRRYSRALARFQRIDAAIKKGDKRPELLKERTRMEYLVETLR